MAGLLKRLVPKRFRKQEIVIPVVRLHGAIMSGGSRFRPALNLASVAPLLEKAFKMKDSPAVALSINSPGGSPVQSRMIYQRIRTLAEENSKTVLVFVEDVAASGGYMIAVAGDEIIADPTSIVGSIGVVSGGFGFPDLLKKIGIERRVYTAGENKVMLDPFQPEKQSDIEYLKTLQLDIHDVFITMVKERRGIRLGDDPDLFSGKFWTGRKGFELGLVDKLASMREEIMARYGRTARLELVSGGRGLFGRRQPGVGTFLSQPADIAGAAASGLAETLEDRALWARYGL
ncbi:S49 family peptidase [Allorhizobium taibaishanense]|uniref:Peptidase S49 n=1 Tax=Allorhizobium taibaishanense TaxID=887144 RepID=A0A1Q9AAB4_9HYPH|nr:S49 family peptidase [Allorhizobium taibaishanense]MBB4006962.1 signal peptide peptidase SppA [Allorhizobium taibaishanense]OLP51788.1 peptidase S49 [Allorhizobium taibaishanense]